VREKERGGRGEGFSVTQISYTGGSIPVATWTKVILIRFKEVIIKKYEQSKKNAELNFFK
jgi:hypothetical protein